MKPSSTILAAALAAGLILSPAWAQAPSGSGSPAGQGSNPSATSPSGSPSGQRSDPGATDSGTPTGNPSVPVSTPGGNPAATSPTGNPGGTGYMNNNGNYDNDRHTSNFGWLGLLGLAGLLGLRRPSMGTTTRRDTTDTVR